MPLKSDVYSLGLTVLSLASLTLLVRPWPLENLKAAAQASIQELGYSAALKNLLLGMLEEREEARPTMQEVCSALLGSGIPPPSEEAKSAPAARASPKYISAEDGSKELVNVTSTFLSFFDFRTSTWGAQVRLNTQIQANDHSRWVMMEELVFCCGGGVDEAIATAYMLARDGAVEQKANMRERWARHGLLAAYKDAYVFGGYSKIKTCEKWEAATYKWSSLPSMAEGRYGFNPCMFEGRVYLCGLGSRIVEAFVPQTNTFLPLRATIPENSSCCLYVDNHLLVIHTSSNILKFAAESDGQLVKRSEATTAEAYKHQSSQPVVD